MPISQRRVARRNMRRRTLHGIPAAVAEQERKMKRTMTIVLGSTAITPVFGEVLRIFEQHLALGQ